MPKRIVRRRTKGWRMPPGTVYVGRPTVWGNPFQTYSVLRIHGCELGIGEPGMIRLRVWSVEESLAWFRIWARERQRLCERTGAGDWLAPLRGKDLTCWCPLDRPWHADVLLELANR